jgi:N-dimethylarginine dimethylaminohydrolase
MGADSADSADRADRAALNTGVEELRALLRPDGADLEIVETGPGRVHLGLDLANVECRECVLPPDLLDQMVREGLRRRVGPELEVVFDDPRRPT